MKRVVIMLTFSVLFLWLGCKGNKAPKTPTKPYGLEGYDNRGYIDSTYSFFSVTTDPEGDQVAYKFNWGTGGKSESGWSNFKDSGDEIKMKHKYTQAGTYQITVKAKDIHNKESEWSDPDTIHIGEKSLPPVVTLFTGEDSTQIGVQTGFSVAAADPEGDDIYYQFDWGDDSTSAWKGTWPSGDTISSGIAYTYEDTNYTGFEVRARAKDTTGSVSEWSAPHIIVVTLPDPPDPTDKPTIEDDYDVYFTQTLFTFKAEVVAVEALTFQFYWGHETDLGDSAFSAWAFDTGSVSLPHAWPYEGDFEIRARTKDDYDQISDWSEPCPFSVTSNLIDSDIGLGELNSPYGIVADGNNIYVVDHGEGVIKKFSTTGGFLKDEIGNGILNSPMYLAVDEDFLYVTDAPSWGANRVYKFAKDGTLNRQWGDRGSGDEEFYTPTGIAVDNDYVYVVDSHNKRIQKIEKNGPNFVARWDIENESRGMDIDTVNGILYIASNFESKILRYTTAGVKKSFIGTPGTEDKQFMAPCAVTLDENYIYISDTVNDRIQVYEKGTYVTWYIKWGVNGSEGGQFVRPQGIAVDADGNIYAADTNNGRVQKFQSLPIDGGAL